MAWWIWVLIGFFLLALELTTAGLHLGFFGAGAIIVGLIVAAGYGGPTWVQLLLFSIVSLVLLLLFRQPMLRRLREAGTDREVDALGGQIAHAITEIAPGAFGKAELRGSSWNARNTGSTALVAGQRCRVAKVDGLTLHVIADES